MNQTVYSIGNFVGLLLEVRGLTVQLERYFHNLDILHKFWQKVPSFVHSSNLSIQTYDHQSVLLVLRMFRNKECLWTSHKFNITEQRLRRLLLDIEICDLTNWTTRFRNQTVKIIRTEGWNGTLRSIPIFHNSRSPWLLLHFLCKNVPLFQTFFLLLFRVWLEKQPYYCHCPQNTPDINANFFLRTSKLNPNS